jgi:diguanylate cyclase (GGDEF)-like protein/PAS domain S-box-containing protein
LALAVVDATGRVVFVNDEFSHLVGHAAAELVGRDIFRLVDEHERPAARQALRRAARTGRMVGSLCLVNGAADRRINVSLASRPLAGGEGQKLYALTARAKSPRKSPVHRQAMLATIARECDEAIISVGAQGSIEIWNHAAEELFGWSAHEVLGTASGLLVPHERQAEAAELLSRSWAGEVLTRVETVRVCKHGSRVEVSISFLPLRDGSGQVTAVSQVIRDITQQRASERALAYQAMHDHLTGLPNRSLLEDRMAHAIERCRREGHSVGVMFFDLDHFKTVNDTAGHDVGDKLLRAVATRLRQSVRSVDTVARMGGDEFVILCEDVTDEVQLDVIVAHIMSSFSEPVVLPDRQLWVSLSGGVVMGGASSSVAQLLSEADAAMYHAKERGRGTVGRYDPRIRPDLERRAEGSRLLRLALEAHQLVPYYQPIVDLHTGTMVGAEALVRWEDPVRGVVAAKDFIPLAEELGLVGEISELVLTEAARQATEWSQLVPGMKVTVNVSPLQLRGAALLTSVRALVKEGLRPASLVLEVTESALMEDTVTTGSVLGELRDAGFGIAIDDFGTGYSSLAYLKQLPATIIKVDQTFTSQLPDPHDLSVVMAILAIADTYGLDVVAEGIETAEQADVLRALGCQQGQGYHFAHAVPAVELSRMLEHGLLPLGAPRPATVLTNDKAEIAEILL